MPPVTAVEARAEPIEEVVTAGEPLRDIPSSWRCVALGNAGSLIRGITYTKLDAASEPLENYLPILRANNIDGSLNFDNLVYVPSKLVNAEKKISIGDIVIAMSSGSKRLVGKSARAKTNFIGSFGAFCGVFRPDMAMNSRYTAFFFESPEYRNTISEASSGSNINNLRREHILEMPFPLPPLEEQRRIVAKLESLFSKLEVGVLALQRARGLLKRYRQSLLRDAVEGKLSAEWRAKQTNLEPASALLERVLRERRAAWEARELARLRAKGTEPLGDAWKARYEEPSAVEVSSLPELPEG